MLAVSPNDKRQKFKAVQNVENSNDYKASFVIGSKPLL